jgi:general secretion pathway protein F
MGPIMHNTVRLRFSRVLSTLWRAGVAPMEAVEIAARATGHQQVLKKIEAQTARLGQGVALGEVLQALDIFQRAELYVVNSGEMSGGIPEALDQVGEYTRNELESQLQRLPVLAQLFLYTVLAPLVGILVIWGFKRYFELFLKRMLEGVM